LGLKVYISYKWLTYGPQATHSNWPASENLLPKLQYSIMPIRNFTISGHLDG